MVCYKCLEEFDPRLIKVCTIIGICEEEYNSKAISTFKSKPSEVKDGRDKMINNKERVSHV